MVPGTDGMAVENFASIVEAVNSAWVSTLRRLVTGCTGLEEAFCARNCDILFLGLEKVMFSVTWSWRICFSCCHFGQIRE